MSTWWERHPGLRQRELDALASAGIAYEVDAEAERLGILMLHLTMQHDGQQLRMRAVYPDLFPYFRPEVHGDSFKLSRHQHPFQGHLCLIGPRTQNWLPSMTLAGLLFSQLPKAIRSAADGSAPEEDQPEPASNYFRYGSSYVLIDGAWRIPTEIKRGTLEVMGAITDEEVPTFRGVVLAVKDEAGRVLCKWQQELPPQFTQRLSIPWGRIGSLDFIDDEREQLAAFQQLHPKFANPERNDYGTKRAFGLVGVLFDEEVQRQQIGDGWQFLLLSRKKKAGTPSFVQRVRAFRAGPSDLGARVPAVQVMRGKTVLVFGAGAVGAPTILELARQGAILRFVDHDIVEPGPTVRWPLGISAYGLPKVGALLSTIRNDYPHCDASAMRARVGTCFPPDSVTEHNVDEWDFLEKEISRADLVIDATAEHAVHHVLSDLCRKLGKPFIYAGATYGAAGGMVARFMPGDDQGCWFCLQHALFTTQELPLPPSDDQGMVAPPGCSEPTFTGAGFDLQEVSLQTVRMAVQALAGQARSAYVVLSFDGDLHLPQWRGFKVLVMGGCECQHSCG